MGGGTCPEVFGFGTCVEECHYGGDNSDCPDSKECCPNGCGHTCMAVQKGRMATPTKYILMVVLVDSAKVDEALALIPTPRKTTVLRSSAIVIIEYSPEQVQTACEAFIAMQDSEDSKSVEWDGKPPECKTSREILP